jgi:hypothetical protein
MIDEELLVRAVQDAVSDLPVRLDGAALRRGGEHRRRRTQWMAPVATAIVVAAVAVGAWAATRPGSTTPGAHTVAPNSGGSTSATPKQLAERAVTDLLAAAKLPPGSVASDSSPTPLLKDPAETWGSPNLVIRSLWFTARQSVTSVLDHFKSHPPQDTKPDGYGSSHGNGGDIDFLTFAGTVSRTDSVNFTGLELLVSLTADRGGAAVRLDTEAIWLPRRTAADRVALTVTSVDVTVDRNGSAETVTRTLAQEQARALARAINGLAVTPPGIRICPADRGFVDALRFRASSGVIDANVRVTGCAGVSISRSDGGTPVGLDPGRVDAMLMADLGLPANYGR